MSANNRGRRPIPSNLKVIRGTDQPCRMNPNEADPDTDKILPPEHLSETALAHWDATVKELRSAGLMTNLDITALAMYCEAYATWVEASEKVRLTGTVVKHPTNGFPMQSPYLAVANKAFEQMRAMLTEFGMTPSSRTRVNTTSEGGKKNRFSGHGKRNS